MIFGKYQNLDALSYASMKFIGYLEFGCAI